MTALDKANKMLTLTAIVLALGLGWAVIRIWSALAADPVSKAPARQAAKQV
jgi:hypothetical protein